MTDKNVKFFYVIYFFLSSSNRASLSNSIFSISIYQSPIVYWAVILLLLCHDFLFLITVTF